MSEGDYRRLLASLCADIDRRARKLGRSVKGVVLPAALGTAMALGAGACSDMSAAYGVPPPHDARVDVIGGSDSAYMAPWDMISPDAQRADATSADGGVAEAGASDARPIDGLVAPAYIAPDAN